MTQSAIALLRQQMEYGHIYDMTKLAQNPVRGSAWKLQWSSLRHRRDSCSSDEVVGSFLRDFELFRTASGRRGVSERALS